MKCQLWQKVYAFYFLKGYFNQNLLENSLILILIFLGNFLINYIYFKKFDGIKNVTNLPRIIRSKYNYMRASTFLARQK
jgi:hypothetical protein